MGKQKLSNEPVENVKNFDVYSPLDVYIVRQATGFGMALNGGTAIQCLARHYDVKERRQRSVNDLDFVTIAENPNIAKFKEDLISRGFVPGKMGDCEYLFNYENTSLNVDVDVAISWDMNIADEFIKIDRVLLCNPIYIFVSKLSRMVTPWDAKLDTDIKDLNTLYDIIEKRNELGKLEDRISRELPGEDPDELTAKLNQWLNSDPD